MSWTYSGNPGSSSLDEVRFAIGDTDSTDPLLSDEEINFLLARYTSPPHASFYACKRISALFARLADKQQGDSAIKSSQKSKRYAEMAGELKEDFALSDIIPYSGGISESDMEAVQADSDAVQPAFTRDLHEAFSWED